LACSDIFLKQVFDSREQDENLSKQIYTLNGKVREINNSLGTHSPDFSSDLRANDKYRCGKDRKLNYY
jgi:hypothetical protein